MKVLGRTSDGPSNLKRFPDNIPDGLDGPADPPKLFFAHISRQKSCLSSRSIAPIVRRRIT